ncbi:MAG TPA: hypothetical protein PL182_03240 [Pseudobdellovibrionaceae bacterium]|nr:hypothetical protein [Pseudobdellovibrionaceae bacterium]
MKEMSPQVPTGFFLLFFTLFGMGPAYAEPPKKGTIGRIFHDIMSHQGGPFAGAVVGGSPSNGEILYQEKKACELSGAQCDQAARLGCDRVETSVLSGTLECWNQKSFRLVDENGEDLTGRSYSVVANLVPNRTQRNLVLAKTVGESRPLLLDEEGQVLADGNILDCENFESSGEDGINCVRGGAKFKLRISDLEKARKASVRLSEVAGDISLNLCGLALNRLDRGESDSFFYDMRSFEGVGKESLDLYKKESSLGSSCTIAPENERCTALYLTLKGLECYSYGRLVFKRPMSVSEDEMALMAKRYVFKNKEIVSMDEFLRAARNNPNVSMRIERPDRVFGDGLLYEESASTSSETQGKR